MKTLMTLTAGVLVGWLAFVSASAGAEQHRATFLGNPATRFAPPLQTPEDLRARFRDPKLQPDFAAVLEQWGWTGELKDLFQAATTNAIEDVQIAIGTTMPFMSTRKNGQPICLRNVTWAGKEPAPAYAFNFSSKGQRYRCITPKACSNFFVEDLGPEPRPALTLECAAPAEVPVGRAVEVCLTVINTGTAPEAKTVLTLPVPSGARVSSKTDRAVIAAGQLTWEIPDLQPNKGKKVCAVFKSSQPATLAFAPMATGSATASVSSACETKAVGVPAILLEVIDEGDPIEVGQEVSYEIKVTNQGSAPGTNIRLTCALPVGEEFVSGSGATPVQASDRTLTMSPVTTLNAKESASWRVVVKAVQAEDARFKVELRSDQFERPITEDESTQLY